MLDNLVKPARPHASWEDVLPELGAIAKLFESKDPGIEPTIGAIVHVARMATQESIPAATSLGEAAVASFNGFQSQRVQLLTSREAGLQQQQKRGLFLIAQSAIQDRPVWEDIKNRSVETANKMHALLF